MWFRTAKGRLLNSKAVCWFSIGRTIEDAWAVRAELLLNESCSIDLELFASEAAAKTRLDEIEKVLQEPECVFFLEEKK